MDKPSQTVKMGRYNFYCPRPLMAKVAAYAAQKGKKQNALITEVLVEFFSDKQITMTVRPKTAAQVFEAGERK